MAVVLFHGAPGSYKTSMAMQEKLIPALKAGRVVVSNIEGLYPLNVIEERLETKFPDTAKLFRISSQTEKGRHLLQRWYHWLPTGVLLILDEVQDIYPEGREFKPVDYNYVSVHQYKDVLPPDLYQLHLDNLDKFKPTELDESHTDDLGEEIFDSDGHIIYPKTLSESFMRHRKYNWDIVTITPDIKKVHSDIRGVCEKAFAHASKDAIPIPYYKRRPRVLEHPAKENGLKAVKGDTVTFPKVKTDVFKIYKSTATGQNNKSGVGKNPIRGKLLFGIVFVLLLPIYYIWFFTSDSEPEEDNSPSNINPDLPVAVATNNHLDKQKNSNAPDGQAKGDTVKVIRKNSIISGDHGVTTVNATFDAGVIDLPYSATEFYLSGYNEVRSINQQRFEHVFVYKLPRSEEQFYIHGSSLASMGYQVIHGGECSVTIVKNNVGQEFYCAPVMYAAVTEGASGAGGANEETRQLINNTTSF